MAHGWLSLALLSLSLAGCATSSPCGRDCHPDVPGRTVEVLPVCGRSELETTSNAGTLLAAYAETLGKPRAIAVYRQLSVRECQCLAVEASPLGNLLDQESQLSIQQAKARKIGRNKAQQAAGLKVQMLTYLAQE